MICHLHLQRIFVTQGLNKCLLPGRQILYHFATWEVQLYYILLHNIHIRKY